MFPSTKFVLVVLTLGSAVSAPRFAQATTTSSPLVVSATVASTCTIVAQPLAFGTYGTAQVDASTTVSVTCTNGTVYSIALDAGQGAGATTTTRVMTGPGAATLNYSLYTNSSRSSVWGATIGANVVTGIGAGLLQSLTVYGRIPASQYPTPGAYTDSITATLTY